MKKFDNSKLVGVCAVSMAAGAASFCSGQLLVRKNYIGAAVSFGASMLLSTYAAKLATNVANDFIDEYNDVVKRHNDVAIKYNDLQDATAGLCMNIIESAVSNTVENKDKENAEDVSENKEAE